MKLLRWIAIAAVILFFGSPLIYGCEIVEQGWRGAKIDLFGSDKGSITETGPGFYVYNRWTHRFIELPIHVQRYAYVSNPEEQSEKDESITAVSSDNLEFKVGVALHYFVRPLSGCAGEVYRTYNTGDFSYLSMGPIRDIVREAVHDVYSQYEAGEIYGAKRPEVMQKVTANVRESLTERVSVEGAGCFVIDNMSLAELKAPESVREAVEQKMKAQQKAEEARAQLEEQRILSRKDSVKAAQDAENNRLIRESITPALIQYQKLQMMKQKWDGRLPRVTGANGGVMLDLGNPQ